MHTNIHSDILILIQFNIRRNETKNYPFPLTSFVV